MNETTAKPSSVLESPWLFFVVVFAWTWLFWLTAAFLGLGTESGGIVLLLLGISGPTIAGITFTYLTKDKAGRREYWTRVISFKRIPVRWYLVILLLPLIMNLVAAGLDRLFGGVGTTWGELALNIVSSPLSVLPSILFFTLIPFLEELGWRHVLDRLQATRTAFMSSLILGVLWAIWHFPLFLVPDTYQAGLGIWSWAFWLFMVGIVPLTFVVTWIYNNTRFSILSIILFHAVINFFGELLAITQRADTIFTGLWFVAAAVVVLVWGPRTMTDPVSLWGESEAVQLRSE
jgi:membrane protease YdiL (CAAX protease family)